ncbi:16S rRNA methyltransferase [Mesobacillus campisalis]|uniref:Ribosomal RNA small subunit methyltransferase E n=1 Tax=Mesobacillus campisalis TaxID=1408103 RepID=A0A0M2SJV6_9BACI|nr:16S rRNA (uracil(1498)-N(3))-methyltransferase [Mesobacillus campisalis]KKK33147.1 16S rRNA methyltransferase [Mesobacillus campisalis]
MQRYFVTGSGEEGHFEITGDDHHHIARVMRMKEGDEILCVTAQGKSALCRIEEITSEKALAAVVKWNEGSPELPVSITIASGLPKGDKLEWIIQKGTELGASEFVPFIASRSVVKWDQKKGRKKAERWQKIAKEAAEQSHRNQIPKIHEPVTLKTLVQDAGRFDFCLIAYEEEARHGEASVLADVFKRIGQGESLLAIFGPEGGLTEQEVHILQEAGFVPCGLGPRILRTETAPLYLLSAASYHFELMR